MSASSATRMQGSLTGPGISGLRVDSVLGDSGFLNSHPALSTLQDLGASAKGGVLVMRDQVHIDFRVVIEAQIPLPPDTGTGPGEVTWDLSTLPPSHLALSSYTTCHLSVAHSDSHGKGRWISQNKVAGPQVRHSAEHPEPKCRVCRVGPWEQCS